MKRSRPFAAVGVSMLGLLLAGCPAKDSASAPSPSGPTAPANVSLLGAGATFPFPLYSKWIDEHARARPSVKINYQAIGSGAGIRQLTARTIDFGASDAPLTDEALAKLEAPAHHVPMTLGAVVLTYNVPGVTGAFKSTDVVSTGSLKLAPDVVADIFLGKITQWNDARIAADNPGVALPALAIVPVYRSDGSGTTFIFTDWLSKTAPAFKEKVGKGTSVKFPTGIGGKGNEGVTGQVKQLEGAIGYVELVYAEANKLPSATLRNKAGKWIAPSVDAVTAAADTAQIPDDLRVSITDAPGEAAYPIASFTWILLFEEMKDAEKGRALVEFLDWALTGGQALAPSLHYAPLPAKVAERARAKLKLIRSGGKPLLENKS